jgi:hypothetical protein
VPDELAVPELYEATAPKLTRKKDAGPAEALLMAEYLRRVSAQPNRQLKTTNKKTGGHK